MVAIHNSVRELNYSLKKSALVHNVISPRDFVDFIKQFNKVLELKKSQTE